MMLPDHCRGVVPLLIDENVHYHLLKLLYGNKCGLWQVLRSLARVPLVYGVWHAYTFCVTQTDRAFFPLLTYLRNGTFKPKAKLPAYPKLGTNWEPTFGCLLKAYRGHERGLWAKKRDCHARSGESARHPDRWGHSDSSPFGRLYGAERLVHVHHEHKKVSYLTTLFNFAKKMSYLTTFFQLTKKFHT